jgi:ferredoxin-like protein FixX
MKYKPPKIEGKPYWVPIVVKSKDHLIGYIEGVNLMEEILFDTLKNLNIEFEFTDLDLFLDSSRFNDIMEDGRRQSELNDIDKKQILMDIVNEKREHSSDPHVENKTEYVDFLSIECCCGLGYYSWQNAHDIPAENTTCSECGRVIIDYTGHNDHEYEYDHGENNDTEKN